MPRVPWVQINIMVTDLNNASFRIIFKHFNEWFSAVHCRYSTANRHRNPYNIHPIARQNTHMETVLCIITSYFCLYLYRWLINYQLFGSPLQEVVLGFPVTRNQGVNQLEQTVSLGRGWTTLPSQWRDIIHI